MPSKTFISLRPLDIYNTRTKIMRSVDGLNWLNVFTTANEIVLLSVATDGKGNWLAVGSAKTLDVSIGVMYTSTDDGQTWVLTEQTLFSLYFIATDSKGTWLAAGKNNNDSTKTIIYKSMDMGKNWLQVNELIGEKIFITIASNGYGTWVLASFDEAQQNASIQYSTDNGDTWLDADTSALGTNLYLFQVVTDGKGTWLAVGSSGFNETANLAALIGKSSDNGKTWQISYSSTENVPGYTGIGTDGQGNWLAVDVAGYINLYSTNNGSTWTPYPQAFPIVYDVSNFYNVFGNTFEISGIITNTIVADGNGGWIATGVKYKAGDVEKISNGRMFYSPNGRSNWTEITLPTETVNNFLTSIATSSTPPLISNICFPGGTPIQTDQGIVPIDLIDTKLHTIHGESILHVTKTVTLDKYLVSFNQGSLGKNLPYKKTIMSKDHQIEFQGQLVPAYRFLEITSEVKKVKYAGEVLYNVLLAKPGLMTVNGLRCETLHPKNVIAQLYTTQCSNQIVHQLNTALLQKDATTYTQLLNTHKSTHFL